MGFQHRRGAVSPLDQHTGVVVISEAGWTAHPEQSAPPQPLAGRVQQVPGYLIIFNNFKKTKTTIFLAGLFYQAVIHEGGNRPGNFAIAMSRKKKYVCIAEESILAGIKSCQLVGYQGGHPIRVILVHPPGKLDEGKQFSSSTDCSNLDITTQIIALSATLNYFG